MNNYLFIFTFEQEDTTGNDESVTAVYLIKITTDEGERLIKYFDGDGEESERFYEMISENEENYGVHDVSFMPDYYAMGYTSYEVETNFQVTVMNNICSFFIDEGFEDSYIITDGVYREMTDVDTIDITYKYLEPEDIKKLNELRQ
jgi:hypothetical protein